MRQNKKNELVGSILTHARNISTSSIIDIFIDYSSHVDLFCIRVLLNGWNEEDFKKALYRKMIWLFDEGCETDLQEIKDYLISLEEDLKNEISR